MDILVDRLFPRLARGVPADEGAGDRRGDGLRRVEERARRLAERRRLLHGEGGGDPPRALPGARRARRTGIRVNVVNPDAVLRGSRIWAGEWLEQRAGTYGTDRRSSRSITASARCSSGRCCRRTSPRRSLPRLGRLGEVDGQHPQRRRGQRAGVHAVAPAGAGYLIPPLARRSRTRRRGGRRGFPPVPAAALSGGLRGFPPRPAPTGSRSAPAGSRRCRGGSAPGSDVPPSPRSSRYTASASSTRPCSSSSAPSAWRVGCIQPQGSS